MTIDGFDIDFCPHTENPLKELSVLKKSKLLFGHMAVHGAQLNKLYGTKADVIVEYDKDMIPVSVDSFSHWQQVLLGHYHGEQRLDNVEYVGSPLQLSFGEAFQDKHVIILELETLKKTYIQNTFSPKHYIITPEEVNNYDLNKHFVRVVGEMTGKDIIDIKKNITTKFQVASLDFKQKDKKEDKIVIDDAKKMVLDEEEMIRTYIKNNAKGLDEKRLMEVAKIVTSSNK